MARFLLLGSLVFFSCLAGCNEKDRKVNGETYEFTYSHNKVTGIYFDREMLRAIPTDSIEQKIRVRLKDRSEDILGDFFFTGDQIRFMPLVPFTRNLEYRVMVDQQEVFIFMVPDESPGDRSRIVQLHPLTGKVPMNLLKMHIEFTQPMQEGVALDHIYLIKNRTDTLKEVFLDLENELWNQERTILTLWLNPGRIKRDLQPNLKLGNPLEKDAIYQLYVDGSWRDANGDSLNSSYTYTFSVGDRDDRSPDPRQWDIYTTGGKSPPHRDTREELVIDFRESLDYLLARSSIRILDPGKKEVIGTMSPDPANSKIVFLPGQKWKKGNYEVYVDGRIEDLAGNNIQRVFDRDLLLDTSKTQVSGLRIPFTVK